MSINEQLQYIPHQVKILENATIIRLSKHKFEWETLLIVFQQHQFTIQVYMKVKFSTNCFKN